MDNIHCLHGRFFDELSGGLLATARRPPKAR